MSSQITVDPAVFEEAVSAVEEERAQLKSDADSTLKIIKGETSASANDSEFASKFTVTADALLKKANNIFFELKNYSDSITIVKEELTSVDQNAKDGISGSSVSGH